MAGMGMGTMTTPAGGLSLVPSRRVPRARAARRCPPRASTVSEWIAAYPFVTIPVMIAVASRIADKVIPGEDVVQMQQKMEMERMEKKLKARKGQPKPPPRSPRK